MFVGENLVWGVGIVGRNIYYWVVGEEVLRVEEKYYWFGRYDGEVFGGWEVGYVKGVLEDNVGVVDGGGVVINLFGDVVGWFVRGLGDVFFCGLEFVVVVFGDVNGMFGKGGVFLD